MTNMTILMRGVLALALLAVLLLVSWFLWYGMRAQVARVEETAKPEATERDTTAGLGVTQSIERAGGTPPDTTGPESETPPPGTDPPADTATPAQTTSPRATLYEEADLELLRRELAADIEDRMATRELRKQALRSPIGASRFSFAPEAAGQKTKAGQADLNGGAEPADRFAASALPALAPSLVPGTPSAALENSEEAFGPGPEEQAVANATAVSADSPADIGYSPHRTVAPRAPYELRKGTVIPGLLATGVNSDIPGFVSGIVRLDVFDTVTGRYLLIPAGSRVFGQYDPDTAYGQRRLEVVWTHLMFPDGDAIVLEGQQATDGAGRSGFADKRKGNFLRTLGGNLLYSVINAGEQAAQLHIEEAITGALPERDGLGDALERLGSGLSGGRGSSSAAAIFNRQQSQLKPTLIIRPGYPFNILVARDLILEPRG